MRNIPELKALIDSGTPVVHLKIGECVMTTEPVIISTVLGSCVSVTFFHRATRYAAMFHAMLPSFEGSKSTQGPCAFADKAVESIMSRYKKLRVPFDEIDVKIFGGANTMRAKERERLGEILDVGKKNAEQALASLALYGLRPKVRDIQGGRGRKVLFYVGAGSIWVKFVDARGQDAQVSRY